MKKSILLIFILLTALFSQTFAKTTRVNKAALWLYLSKMQTYSANFEQITSDAKGRVVQKSYGKMALKRPGYLKWETLNPTHQQLFVSKNIVWVYDVDLEQASRNTLHMTDNNPGALLSSPISQIKRQFIINSVETDQNLTCFTLHQRKASSDKTVAIGTITLCFQNTLLQSMTLTQNFGGRSQFVFSNIRLNQSIPASFFQFVPGNNVELIDQSTL
jgi:outer membrane lipoprotein carrier protein